MPKSENPQTDVFIELHIPDFALATKFYEKLGFTVVWQEEPPKGYLVMQKGESIINFYGGDPEVYQQEYFKKFPEETPRGYAVEIILLSDDIDKYYQELSAKINSITEPLSLRPWGRKDFRLTDPFGFYIRVSERYNWINKYS